jgi:hypothetical protein
MCEGPPCVFFWGGVKYEISTRRLGKIPICLQIRFISINNKTTAAIIYNSYFIILNRNIKLYVDIKIINMETIGQSQFLSKNCNVNDMQKKSENSMTINLHFLLFYTHRIKHLKENGSHGFFTEIFVASKNNPCERSLRYRTVYFKKSIVRVL